ncbi:MAG: hypothetical protein GF349_00175 [Candidatus Magasanikbacteria bacterium]|nr:hypothetical protein [Candidatus Magasanikbacteria bacterium]
MGIQVEFNPDLALRNYFEFKNGNRKAEECISDELVVGQVYNFLKKGQRNYWLEGEIPLLETKGNQELSRPLASIVILEARHFILDDEIYTSGKYRVEEVFKKNDETIHFDGFAKIE